MEEIIAKLLEKKLRDVLPSTTKISEVEYHHATKCVMLKTGYFSGVDLLEACKVLGAKVINTEIEECPCQDSEDANFYIHFNKVDLTE